MSPPPPPFLRAGLRLVFNYYLGSRILNGGLKEFFISKSCHSKEVVQYLNYFALIILVILYLSRNKLSVFILLNNRPLTVCTDLPSLTAKPLAASLIELKRKTSVLWGVNIS